MKKNITILTIGIIFFILSGVSNRYLSSIFAKDSLKKIVLPVPLSKFPSEIGNWNGKDMELSSAIQQVAGNDDFVNRSYFNAKENKFVSFYIAYAGQPRNMLGHRPQICYPGAGWIHESTDTTEFESSSGQVFPCLIHSFRKPLPDSSRVKVLNYYILNGIPTNEESEFNSLSFRIPNVDGKLAHYVAQVQISSTVESNIIEFAQITADTIVKYLPDENGVIKIQGEINEQE